MKFEPSKGDITLLTRYFSDCDVVSAEMFKAVSDIIVDYMKYSKVLFARDPYQIHIKYFFI